MSIYVNSLINKATIKLNMNECCIDNSYIVVADSTNIDSTNIQESINIDSTNTTDWVLEYTFLNFSKMNVPFRHRVVITPLYDMNRQLVYLMGVSYYNNDISPTYIMPISRELDELKKELNLLSAAISLTTPCSPFIIKYVNPKWESLCGYKSVDALGKTFKILQGIDKKSVQKAFQIKREIVDIMR